MKKSDALGQFEQLVLASVLVLGQQAYGVTIFEKVGEMAERPVKIGSVYITLDRLEDKGMVSSWLSDPTAERGGRAKRCYRLEALGEREVVNYIAFRLQAVIGGSKLDFDLTNSDLALSRLANGGIRPRPVRITSMTSASVSRSPTIWTREGNAGGDQGASAAVAGVYDRSAG